MLAVLLLILPLLLFKPVLGLQKPNLAVDGWMVGPEFGLDCGLAGENLVWFGFDEIGLG